MWPRNSRQQLPPDGSELAVNCDMLSGDLRAIRGAVLRKAFTSPGTIKSAFRIPASYRDDVEDAVSANLYSDDDVWFTSDSDFTHFVKGPLVADKYDRYYWTKPGQRPRYASLAQLIAGGTDRDGTDPTQGGTDPYYILGCPAPKHIEPDDDADPVVVGDMFTVTASGGTNDLKETRCYVYTFINVFGEESAPSLPVCAEGNGDGTWTLAGLKTAFEEPWLSEGAPIAKTRIYRTITGKTGGSFFFVDEIEPPAASYVDDISTDEVSLNAQLESDAWAVPPENLLGILRHPNGFLIGFEEGGDLRFSIPYRPHAWPAEFALSTEGDIQALGIFGQSAAVLTNAHPYVATGVNPINVTLTKSDTSAPCISRNSVVSFEEGVLYASPDGLNSVSPRGFAVLTEQIVSKGEWQDRYDPSYIHASQDGYRYVAVAIYEDKSFPRQGLIYAPREQQVSTWSELNIRNQQELETLQTDPHNGDLLSVINNSVFTLNSPFTPPQDYQWRSTEFVTAKPCNFGAYRIDFDTIVRYPEQAPESETLEEYLEYNRARMGTPLDTLNHHAFNDVRVEVLNPPSPVEQLKQPLGGSPLLDILAIGRASISVRLYGNRVLRYAKTLTKTGIYRLPEGYKTDIWQVEFIGNADLHHFKMGETGKELARA